MSSIISLPKYMLTDISVHNNVDTDSLLKALDKMTNKEYYGELQPIDYNNSRTINLSNVSHEISNIFVEDNKIWGDVYILDTPKGKILKKTYELSGLISFDMRIVGRRMSSGGKYTGVLFIDYISTWDARRLTMDWERHKKIEDIMNF